MLDNIFLIIRSHLIWLLIAWLISAIGMFITARKVLKIQIVGKNEISDALISTFIKRYFYYLSLLILSYMLDMIEIDWQWCGTIKVILIIGVYSFISRLIVKTFKTAGDYDRILEKNQPLVMTVEMLLLLIIMIFDNNYLFSIGLSCLLGKWCWLDGDLQKSVKKVFNDIKEMFSNDSMKKYYSVYLTAFYTAIIFKLICTILHLLIPELNLDGAYAITGMMLLISIIIVMEIICACEKFNVNRRKK